MTICQYLQYNAYKVFYRLYRYTVITINIKFLWGGRVLFRAVGHPMVLSQAVSGGWQKLALHSLDPTWELRQNTVGERLVGD